MVNRYTNLKRYALCPYRCFREAALGEDEETCAKGIGQIAHKAIELVLTGMKGSYSTVIEKAHLLLKEELKDLTEPIDDEQIKILMFCARPFFTQVTGPGVVYEKKYKINLCGDETIEFQSTVDVIDQQRKKIWDWKTGYLKSDPMQLKVYCYVLKLSGIEIEEASFIYLRDKTVQTIKITPEVLKEAEEYLVKNVMEIESKMEELLMGGNPEDVFSRKKNEHCKTCQFLIECMQRMSALSETKPEINEGSSFVVKETEKQVLTDDSKARDMGLEILRLEALVNRFKDALKIYVKANGDVVCDNKKFTFVPSTTWSFVPDKLKLLAMAILEEGVNPWELLTLGGTNVKKLNWDEDKLKMFGLQKISQRFGCVSLDGTTPPDT